MRIYIVEHWAVHNMQDDILEYYEVFKSKDVALNANSKVCEDDRSFIRAMNIDGAAKLLCAVDIK